MCIFCLYLSVSVCLSLCLCLSPTHTHTYPPTHPPTHTLGFGWRQIIKGSSVGVKNNAERCRWKLMGKHQAQKGDHRERWCAAVDSLSHFGQSVWFEGGCRLDIANRGNLAPCYRSLPSWRLIPHVLKPNTDCHLLWFSSPPTIIKNKKNKNNNNNN